MSLLRRTAHSISSHTRPSLSAINTTRRISHPGIVSSSSSSPCANRRNFSVASALGETVTATADGLSWAHSVGVPWYVAIPLLAVGVNATIRFPLQLYSARLREARKPLDPLITAWARRHIMDGSLNSPELPDRVRSLRLAGAVEKSKRRIFKTWGLQRWKGAAPLLGMVPFVTISEALRRKCGAPLGWISHKIGLGDTGLGPSNSMFDQSLVDGGLFWFTDLASADPYYGLPVICSGILVWSIWARMPKEQIQALLRIQPSGSRMMVAPRLQQLLGRVMLMMPLLPLLFADLPSAIFLYWGTSFALTRVNDFFIQHLVTPKTPDLRAPKPSKEFPFVLKDQSRIAKTSDKKNN
ncbi:mitochondrial export translocase Oxa2 [Fusarium phyllophilum]|uniref:Mitochondrial export translocase Oxa2 n=1 Tax=Fusarium phyllophilum TaxID=47803 RepID=A0A8H5NL84_9HYPO|nr:mitochondrial export translocase Oxa2 [Fusarium phyllophilum]